MSDTGRSGCAPRGVQCSARHQFSGSPPLDGRRRFVTGQSGSVRDAVSSGDVVGTFLDQEVEHEVEPERATLRMTPELRTLWFPSTSSVQSVFRRRACVMRSCPNFLVGAAMRIAMTEAELGANGGDEFRRTGAWKLFLLLPRCSSADHPRSFSFNRGQWINLLIRVKIVRNVHRKQTEPKALVQIGELSAGRQALEGAPLAPGNVVALRELQNALRGPPGTRFVG